MPKRRARHQKANPRKRAKDTATFDLLSWRVEEPVAPAFQESTPGLALYQPPTPPPPQYDENEAEAVYNFVRNDRPCYDTLAGISEQSARRAAVGLYDHESAVREVTNLVVLPCKAKYRREFRGEEAADRGRFTQATLRFAAEMLVDDMESDLGIARQAHPETAARVLAAKANDLHAETAREQAVIDRHMGAVVQASYPDGSVVAVGRVVGGEVKRTPVYRPQGGEHDGARRRRSAVVPGPPQAVLVVESAMTGKRVSFGTHGVNLRVTEPASAPFRAAPAVDLRATASPGDRQMGWKFNAYAASARNVSDAGNVREGRELLLWMASNSRQWDPVTRVFRSFLVQRAAGTYSRDAYRGHLDAVVKDAAVAFRRAHPGAAHRFSPTTQAMVVDHILYDFETHHGNAPLTRR